MRPDNKITLQPNQGDAYRYLLISLFLIILCFFVMLNSLAEKNKKKTEKLIENVRYEFSGKNLHDKINSFKTGGNIVGAYKVFGIREQMEKFLTYNGVEKLDINQHDKYLRFSLRNSIIFFENQQNLKYTGINLLREISKLINNYTKYGKLSVMVIVNSDSENYQLTLQRIKKIESIVSYNADREMFTFGISSSRKEENNKIKFIIGFR